MVDLSLRSHLWLLNRSGTSYGQRPVECWGFEGGPRQVQHERIRMLTERCGSFRGCQTTPVAAELWALTDPANGAVVDVDADQLALPTVTYVRDATDRIVARTATGEGTVRYAHSGAGDAPQVTLNTSNQVTRVTVALPGGGIYHHDPVSPTTSKWSYLNLQGTIAAQANMSGVKLGATMIFDPDGIPVAGGTADTRPGSMDDAWLGGHARPVELLPGLQPVIEIGARQYSPVLGRFLETEPIEGGCANDYVYGRGDPLNGADLSGANWLSDLLSGGARSVGEFFSDHACLTGQLALYVALGIGVAALVATAIGSGGATLLAVGAVGASGTQLAAGAVSGNQADIVSGLVGVTVGGLGTILYNGETLVATKLSEQAVRALGLAGSSTYLVATTATGFAAGTGADKGKCG